MIALQKTMSSIRNKKGPTRKENETPKAYHQRDKRLNKPAFNKMAKIRRRYEKFKARNRKKNRKCGYRG